MHKPSQRPFFHLLENEQPANVLIFNAFGQLVKSAEGVFPGEKLAVLDLPQGVFWVRVLQNGLVVWEGKLVVLR